MSLAPSIIFWFAILINILYIYFVFENLICSKYNHSCMKNYFYLLSNLFEELPLTEGHFLFCHSTWNYSKNLLTRSSYQHKSILTTPLMIWATGNGKNSRNKMTHDVKSCIAQSNWQNRRAFKPYCALFQLNQNVLVFLFILSQKLALFGLNLVNFWSKTFFHGLNKLFWNTSKVT